MRWINASGIIAMVADTKAGGNWAMFQKPRGAVGANRAGVPAKPAITLA